MLPFPQPREAMRAVADRVRGVLFWRPGQRLSRRHRLALIGPLIRRFAKRSLALCVLALVTIGCSGALADQPVSSSLRGGVVPLTVVNSGSAVRAYARVAINGRTYFFVVDTGAAQTVIETKFASALGLPSEGPAFTTVSFGSCRGSALPVLVSNWRLGRVQLPPSVIAESNIQTGVEKVDGRPVIGLLGSDVLSLFGRATFEFHQQRLMLGPNAPMGGRVVKFTALHIPGGGYAELTKMRINGKPVTFLVDTGAGLTYINGQSARQLRLERLGRSGRIGGANGCSETVHFVGLDDWSMGGMTLPSTYALAGSVALIKGSSIHGLLGPDVLAEYRRVTFDFIHERLVMQGPPRYTATIRDIKPGSPVTPEVLAGADERLAQTTLADQVAALRRGGGWSRGGMAGEGLQKCAATASSALHLTGRANSATLSYDHGMQLRLEDYLYSDAAAAKRAFRSLRSKDAETCIENFLVANTSEHHLNGTVDVIAPKSVRAGDQARAAAIIVPLTYGGRAFRNYDDYVVARKGRVIVVISTAAGATTLSYDVKLDRWITQLPSTERAGRPKSTRPRQATTTGLPIARNRDAASLKTGSIPGQSDWVVLSRQAGRWGLARKWEFR